ncbi:MAG: methionine synthase [Dehalococcoidales bacterium]|nr:methionine synthase [Dehalococcoidales bacterium]
MKDTSFNCLPTMIGSMPQKDPNEACSIIERFLKDIPCWPQLPNRSFKEGMAVQFSAGFPGIIEKGNDLCIDSSIDSSGELEKLYTAYLENNTDKYPVTAEYAAGFYCLLKQENLSPMAVKGQIIGPISWGLSVKDDSGKAILYDEILSDAAAKMLRLKAGWQEKALKQISKNTIIFIDEPAMTSYGSAFFSLPKDRIICLLEEVITGICGLKGIHCCGNTDWSLILETGIDIISFDTYNFSESLTLYPADVKDFLGKKGAIAWGIIPTDEVNLQKETVSSLKDRLEEAMAPFTRKGVPFKRLIEHGLLTPSCGLAGLNEEAATLALELLTGLSKEIRKRYG